MSLLLLFYFLIDTTNWLTNRNKYNNGHVYCTPWLRFISTQIIYCLIIFHIFCTAFRLYRLCTSLEFFILSNGTKSAKWVFRAVPRTPRVGWKTLWSFSDCWQHLITVIRFFEEFNMNFTLKTFTLSVIV